MQIKGQTAIEFLTTYGFVFLIIALALLVLLLLSSIPKTVLPAECSFYGGFNCEDTVYFNSGFNSQFVIVATDSQSGIVNISNFSANIGYLQSYKGSCTPKVVTAGQTVYCIANFSSSATLGQLYSVTFHVSANYCSNAPGSLDNATCIASKAYSYGGQARVQGGPYTPSDLPPLADVFCIGGSGGTNQNVYFAPTSGLAYTGNWFTTANYPVPITDAGCSIYKNYIYCIGTNLFGNGQKAYYSALQSNGIVKWISTTNAPIIEEGNGCSTYQNHIYCVGSYGTFPISNQVYYAPIGTSGIGNWIQTTNYPLQFTYAGCSIYNGYIYCIGGGYAPNNAYFAPITSNGIGNWIQTTNYPAGGLTGAGCSIYNNYIYCVGGTSNSIAAYYAPIIDRGIGQWKQTTTYPSTASIKYEGCFITNGNIYCVGSFTGSGEQVYYAPVTSNGIGTWTAGGSYPSAMYNGYCAVPGSGGGFLGGGGNPN